MLIRTNRKFPTIALVAIVWLVLACAMGVTVYGSPQYGFGTGQGRTDTVNTNDYHTAAWERFFHNYQFTSGSDHRFELGRPTQFNGFVPADIHTVNMRRDANVSLRPPGYGIFSGIIPTEPSNRLFPQPVNPHFHQAFQLQDSGLDPRFDTLKHGVNADPIGNPLNMHNVGVGEFLPPTSVGIGD
jgi:hypothetical protein